MKVNLFTDGSVIRSDFARGALETANGVGMPQPWPIFQNWYILDVPPSGGLGTAGISTFQWKHGNEFFIVTYWSNSNTYSGVQRRTIVGDPPTHTVFNDFISNISMFGSGVSGQSWTGVYDPIEGAVYMHHWRSSTAVTNTIGKWLMSSWPFSPANAEWIGIDTSWGTYQAGKISYYAWDMMVANGYLFVTSYATGSVLVINASTGAVVGEWAYDTTFNSAGVFFSLIGYDATNNRIIGGGITTPSGTEGNLIAWDISDLNNWTDAVVLLPNLIGTSSPRPWEIYGSTLLGLRGGVPLAASDPRTFSVYEQSLLKHYIPNDSYLFSDSVRYLSGAGYGIYEANLAGDIYHKHLAIGAERLGGGSSIMPTHGFPSLIDVGGTIYLILAGAGTKEMIDANGAYNSECLYGQCVDQGTYRAAYTVSSNSQPTRLFLKLGPSGRDREDSLNLRKHAFRSRVKLSGQPTYGSWTDWRSHYELNELDTIVNGKAAWQQLNSGDTIQIEHMMTGAHFRDLGPVNYGGIEKTPEVELASIRDCANPQEVQPVLELDTTSVIEGVAII